MINRRSFLIDFSISFTGMTLICLCLATGCSTQTEDEVSEIVYIDSKTGDLFMLASRASPEEHPVTGDSTLYPGLYCEKCNKWRAVGMGQTPQDLRSGRNCPVHNIPMTKDGPMPQ